MTGHALKISSAALKLIKKQQGLSLEKYHDENGLPVIGYGHVIRKGDIFRDHITPARAEDLLHDDIDCCEALIHEYFPQSLTQQQHDALALMIFNFGVTSPALKTCLQTLARV